MQYHEIEFEEDYDEEIEIKEDEEDLPMIKALLKRTPLELSAITTHGIVDMEVVGKKVEKDVELQKIIERLKENPKEEEDWTMDFIEGLPLAGRVNVIMVVVDRLTKKKCEKLAPKYYEPYRIKEEIGEVVYRLELPPEAAIHDVFHISQLKLKLGKQQRVQHQHPKLIEEFEL
ncbi:disease resistance protein [Cucumis melo var. makuwa]|uniref:Disease resistance protein n=1 Tax=Cucumis melo var. makuwa TaxID=1194695 RepID=A0A5A7TN17_CUCMM|nr:disease resistance protein [Cucumis melo var. makuwa]